MNLLLDTHVFLWWLSDHKRLSKEAYAAIHHSNNVIFVSAATAWEIAIKKSIGKLEFSNEIEEILILNNFQALPISIAHASHAGTLPPHHSDPFDRLLIAQAQIEEFTLVTHDQKQKLYDVSVIMT